MLTKRKRFFFTNLKNVANSYALMILGTNHERRRCRTCEANIPEVAKIGK